jgi:hypothetical protein
MKTVYCQDKESATVTVTLPNGRVEVIESSAPPVTVHFGEKSNIYQLFNLDTQTVEHTFRLPEVLTHQVLFNDLYAFALGGTRTVLIDYGRQGSVGYRPFSHFWNPLQATQKEIYDYRLIPVNKGLFAITDSQQLLFDYETSSQLVYEVKCDQCEPNECKGSKARYPGYVCLDCKDLESRLQNAGVKINGIQRR